MRKTPATVLSVSPAEEVHFFAARDLQPLHMESCTRPIGLPSALAVIRAQTIPWFFAKRLAAGHMAGFWWSRSRALPIPRPSS